MTTISRFLINHNGRDLAVGDIHGHFSRLERALVAAHFDPQVDRLFSVGDLVDRGPEPERALAWLAQPWFHAVRGNHEDYAIRWAKSRRLDTTTYRRNGGGWFLDLTPSEQERFARAFAALPFAIEVETEGGIVGIVHADCPAASWRRVESALQRRAGQACCIWSRERLTNRDESGVADVHAVVVGHSPVEQPTALANVYHIDTAGWMPGGYFTLFDLDRLAPVVQGGNARISSVF
nr:metallophosphoesterase [Pseudomonas sp.]